MRYLHSKNSNYALDSYRVFWIMLQGSNLWGTKTTNTDL